MIARVVLCIAYLVLAPLLGGLLDGVDRVITARMQGRRGPSVWQPIWDVSKLLKKELLMVNRAQFVMVGSYTLFVILSGALFFAGNDILLSFFALTTAEIFLVMGASCASSPYSAMGANRELIQMASYEPMVLLAGVGFYLADGTFKVADIATHPGIPAIVKLPGFFVGFVFILSIKLRKSPFDVSTSHHAHQEMVKGTTTEMEGSTLALVTIADWYEEIMLMGIVMLFVLNGTAWSVLLALIVAELVYFLQILIDNTCARVKWQVMFKGAWAFTLLAGGVNLLILQMIR
jgi:ech hydrogenase subunit B